MTRINLIRPIALADQHLIAEIKEINQLSGSFQKSLNSKKGVFGIPNDFTLNTGHVKFFYNKGQYLHNRFLELKSEAIERGFTINAEFYNPWLINNQLDLYNNWEPNANDVQLLKQRIIYRVIENPKQPKPDYWYKYYKQPISNSHYCRLLNSSSL